MSLLSGSGLPVWVSTVWLGLGLVEGHFHKESSFLVRSSCLGFELMVGLGSTC